MTESLAGIFESLEPSGTDVAPGSVVGAAPIDSDARCHLARTPDSRPVLFIAESEGARSDSPVRLQNMAIEHSVTCVIRTAEGDVSGDFTLVHCLSENTALQRIFLDLLDSKLFDSGAKYSPEIVSETLVALVDLFRAAVRPAIKNAQGVWAELLVIDRSHDVGTAVRSWRNDDRQLYDFALGSARLEVKSSSTASRNHYFSLEQLNPGGGIDVRVISLFARRVENGLKIRDLWQGIDEKLGGQPELRAKLHQVCTESLGQTLEHSIEMAFDIDGALASLAVYRLDDVPRLTEEPPPGVSEVRMRCDLGMCDAIAQPSAEAPELFRVVLC